MREYIKNEVNALRLERGVTQEALAHELGVTRQTIIAIEKGNYSPSVHLVLKMSRYFNVPVERLFTIAYEK